MVPTDELLFRATGRELEDYCESEYTLHDGTLLMPVMGDSTQTPVVVRIHPPYTTRKASFRYSNTKAPPLVPPPGDTRPNGIDTSLTAVGDTYLGGSLTLPAPIQNANTDLVYKITGSYNFLVANDVRMNGKMRFDSHNYPSLVDFLGAIDPPDEDTWTSPYYDLNLLASARILG